MNQQTALDVLKMGYNVFLTGAAGSGKTYLLNAYIRYLRERHVSVAVTASTGIAATHLGGLTIHSWSGIGVRGKIDEYDLNKLAKNRKIRERIKRTEVLIIDEISMLHARQLDMVEKVCRKMKDPFRPFGGLQIILCGDFFQLPPVVTKNEGGGSGQPTPFVCLSDAWRRAEIKVCYLDEQHRQGDDPLLKLLNAIRTGTATDETAEAVLAQTEEVVYATDTFRPARLFTHNADVDAINARELAKLPGMALSYTMRGEGKEKLIEFLRGNCLAPEKLVLREGAQVMFVRNNFERGYVNGTLGQVIGFDRETRMPIVRTFDDREIVAAPETWELEDNDEVVAQVTQVPLRLAWAITVHKSQGMSLDAAEIDLSRTFEYGMGYVALSRVRTLAGVRLLGWSQAALQVHPEITVLDAEFLEQSAELDAQMAALDSEEKQRRQVEFLRVAGFLGEGKAMPSNQDGAQVEKRKQKKLKKEKPEKSDRVKMFSLEEIRKKFPHAYEPWTEVLDDDLKQRFSCNERPKDIAVAFGRQPGSIRSRLKRLGLTQES